VKLERTEEHNVVVAALRGVALFLLLCLALIDGWLRRPSTLAERILWSQGWAKKTLRLLRGSVQVKGTLPVHGLIASNHVSYVDVIVLASQMPTVFVAKAEVQNWPLIGLLCKRAGVIFINRESIRAAAVANRVVEAALRSGLRVVVFPEGTTSAGDTILPLHAALFQAALSANAPILPVWLQYVNDAERARIAYWGDMTLVPHLFAMMRLRSMEARVHVAAAGTPAANRAQAAQMCDAAWRQMMEGSGEQAALTQLGENEFDGPVERLGADDGDVRTFA